VNQVSVSVASSTTMNFRERNPAIINHLKKTFKGLKFKPGEHMNDFIKRAHLKYKDTLVSFPISRIAEREAVRLTIRGIDNPQLSVVIKKLFKKRVITFNELMRLLYEESEVTILEEETS